MEGFDRAEPAASGGVAESADTRDMRGRQRTALASIAAAVALVLLKLVTGLVTGSLGLVSAGVESSGDVVAAVTTLLALRLARRPPDEEHQYGHMRIENVAALVEAAILIGGGAFVVHQAHARLVAGGEHELHASWYVFLVLAVAILVDVSRTLTSLRTARRYRSAALRSNAFHFGADLVGTVAVLVGLLFVRAGYASADAIAALFVSALIFLAAGRLLLENLRSLIDTAPPAELAAARAAVEGLAPEVELRRLRLREAAGSYFADVVVGIPATAALAEGHTVADRVEEAIGRAVPGADVIVHVEPNTEGQSLTEHVLAAALSVPGVREAHNVTVLETTEGYQVALHLKLPAEMALAAAREVAARVEAEIVREVPGIASVWTHFEPLEQPFRAQPVGPADRQRLGQVVAEVVAVSGEVELREMRFAAIDDRFVGLIKLAISEAADVAEAHRVASVIEERVRDRLPEIRDLIIETEPVGQDAQPPGPHV
jgi:cation diffusion facilitator family transporter